MAQADLRSLYTPRSDATAEGELSALVGVYRLLLDSHANRNAASVPSTDGDDAMKGSKNDRAIRKYTG